MPLNTFNNKKPFKATIKSVTKLTGCVLCCRAGPALRFARAASHPAVACMQTLPIARQPWSDASRLAVTLPECLPVAGPRPKATGETCDVVIDTRGEIPFWEGQSYGVIPPVRVGEAGWPRGRREGRSSVGVGASGAGAWII